jgi:hypothetical protein
MKIVTAQSAVTMVAEAAHSTEAHLIVAQVTTTLTERSAVARAVVVVVAAVEVSALTGAMIMGAAALLVSARTTTAMSGVIRDIRKRAQAANGARMIAVAMDASGMRRRAITRGAGPRSVGAAIHARTCVAATS